jgi:hypothetical protein
LVHGSGSKQSRIRVKKARTINKAGTHEEEEEQPKKRLLVAK